MSYTPTNLTENLLENLPVVLASVGGCLGLNSDPNVAFPIVTYNLIAQSQTKDTGYKAFDSDIEVFRIQVSVFDDDAELVGLIQTQSAVEACLADKSLWVNVNLISCRYLGGFGPTYLGGQKYWQFVKDYSLVLAKNKE